MKKLLKSKLLRRTNNGITLIALVITIMDYSQRFLEKLT